MSDVDDEAEVTIPAGPFPMGRRESDLFASAVEQPLRTVTLTRAFALDAHPVSNRRYRLFVDAGGYRQPRFWSRDGWRWLQETGLEGPRSFEHAYLAEDTQPVCGVSWHEAQAFCAFVARRLPTSAEWERAARGGDERLFPWGDALPRRDLCNFNDDLGRTSVLGRYPAGVAPCGAFDMAGNVNNWVEDVDWPEFGAWCVREDRLTDPVLDEALATELGVDPSRRTDRGGGFLTAFERFEVVGATYPLGWAATQRELWHGFRTARFL